MKTKSLIYENKSIMCSVMGEEVLCKFCNCGLPLFILKRYTHIQALLAVQNETPYYYFLYKNEI